MANKKKSTKEEVEPAVDEAVITTGGAVTDRSKSSFGIVVSAAVLVAVALIALGYAVYNEAEQPGDQASESTQQITDSDQSELADEPISSEQVPVDTSATVTNDDIQAEISTIDQDLSSLESEEDYNENQLNDNELER